MDGEESQTWGPPCNPSVSCKLHSTQPLESLQMKETYVGVKQGMQSIQYAFFLTLCLWNMRPIWVQNWTVVTVHHTRLHRNIAFLSLFFGGLFPVFRYLPPWWILVSGVSTTGGDVSDGEARALSTRWMLRAATRWRPGRFWSYVAKIMEDDGEINQKHTHTHMYIYI